MYGHMLFQKSPDRDLGHSRLSLRMRMVLLICAMALPIPLLIGLGSWRIEYGVRYQQRKLMLWDAQTLAQLADSETTRVLSVLQILAASPTLKTAHPGVPSPVLQAQVAAASATLDAPVLITLPNGMPLASAGLALPSAGQQPLNQAERQVVITGQPVIGLLRYPSDGTGPELPIAVPVFESGNVALVVATRLRLSNLQGLMQARPLQPGWVQSLLDHNGTVIARTLHRQESLGRPAPISVTRNLAHGSLVTMVTTLEGAHAMMALVRAPRSGLVATVVADTTALNGPLYPFLAGLAAIGLVPTLAGLLAGILLARRILFAIKALGEIRPGHAPATHLHETDELAHALAAAQLALGDGEARWRALAEAVSSVVWRLQADGRIHIVSAGGDPALQPLFSPEDWLRHAHPDDRVQAEAIFAAARAAGDGFTIALRMRTHDGRYHPITLRGVRLTATHPEWIGAASLADGPLAATMTPAPA